MRTSLSLLAILLLPGCIAEPEITSQRYRATTLKVAAIQYASGQASAVKAACGSATLPDACAVTELTAQAQAQGAILVVAPELALDQTSYEPTPAIGDLPATDPRWPDGSYLRHFSLEAKQRALQLVIHLWTQTQKGLKHSTQVAYGTDGKVIGLHHKFELFASEQQSLTPGTDVMVFDSPLGKVGLLICADIYGDLALHSKLAESLKARVVALSTFWTAKGAPSFFASYARNWGVYLLASNTTSGTGLGGGIYDPEGKALASVAKTVPGLLVEAIPTP